MAKIDLERLSSLEKKYEAYPITQVTLQNLVIQVISDLEGESPFQKGLAFNTLTEMGVIKEE